jgi:Tfp pilus assembly protein PilZ
MRVFGLLGEGGLFAAWEKAFAGDGVFMMVDGNDHKHQLDVAMSWISQNFRWHLQVCTFTEKV